MTGSADTFFRDDDDAPLQQGDVLLAPTTRLTIPAAPSGLTPGAAFDQTRAVLDPPDQALRQVQVQAGWGPLVVVSHDCHLDKDFNRRYRALRAAGHSKKDAIRVAEDDPTLDRWVNVAPVIDPLVGLASEDEGPAATARAALAGQVVGALPVPPHPERGVEGGVADLTWLATIDRATIVARLASMTEYGRNLLRLALARSAALRTPAVGFLLEDIVGDRIDDATRAEDDPLVIELRLHRTGTIRLLAGPGEPSAGGPQRTRTSAPGGPGQH